MDLRLCARNSVNPLKVKSILLDRVTTLDYDPRYLDLVPHHLVRKRHAKRWCPESAVAMRRAVVRAVVVWYVLGYLQSAKHVEEYLCKNRFLTYRSSLGSSRLGPLGISPACATR